MDFEICRGAIFGGKAIDPRSVFRPSQPVCFFTVEVFRLPIWTDRPAWTIDRRVRELHGANILTLGERVVHDGFINRRLQEDYEIHGHLVRTLLTDLLRRERPDSRWAAQHMLGHTDRYMQDTYRSDFAESGAIRAMDQRFGDVEAGG